MQMQRKALKSKQEFLAQKGRQNLTKKQQDNRWRQYLASHENRNVSNRAGKNFKIVRQNGTDTLIHKFSPCAMHYLLALQAPFMLTSSPCVPDLHSIPSKKTRAILRSQFSTGSTTGSGYVILNPWNNCNNISNIVKTDSAFAGTSIISVGTGVSGVLMSQLPYSSTEFEATASTPGVQARTVGVGIRIKYIGPELSKSGEVVAIRHPDNQTLVGLTGDQLRQYATATRYSVSKKWTYVYYRPVKPSEYEFSIEPLSSGGGPILFPIGLWIEGTRSSDGSLTSAPFVVEVIRFVEYIGQVDNVTRSHTDIDAMSHIRNALPTQSSTKHPLGHLGKTVDSIGRDIEDFGAGALATHFAKKAYDHFVPETKAIEDIGMEAAEAETADTGLMSLLPEIPAMGELGELASFIPFLL